MNIDDGVRSTAAVTPEPAGRRRRHVRRGAISLLAVLALATPMSVARAAPSNAFGPNASPTAVTDARGLLAAVQGGRVLGVPPLPSVLSGASRTLMTPEFWSTFVKEATENNRILLPTPIDPVKPDLVLPHAPIASGDPAALHDVSVPLEKIAYSWDGRSKTVGDYLKDSGTDAIVFVHNGTVIAEYYENGYSPTVAHQAWSMTKSFVSTLVGIARDQGRIRSLDDPIDRYVPELRGTAWRGTAIRNILEMRSGIEWDEHTSSVADNNQITEWIDLALDYYSRGALGRTRDEYLSSLPRVTPQGTTFNYNSGNPQVLAWMLEKLYGKPFNDVLSEQLWKPSGMEAPADIMTDRTGAAIASEELFARPRDFARFGELMGNDGRAANGRQVVSAAYVREATALVPSRGAVGDDFGNGTTVGDAVSAGGYGYQWWNGATPDGFQANGFQGQYITVGPDAGLTGVRLAHTVLLNRGGDYVGGGAAEWHAVYRAVMHHLG